MCHERKTMQRLVVSQVKSICRALRVSDVCSREPVPYVHVAHGRHIPGATMAAVVMIHDGERQKGLWQSTRKVLRG